MNEREPHRTDLTKVEPPRVAHRTVLLSIAGFWLFYFLVMSCRASLIDWGDWALQWTYIQARAVVSLVGMFWVYLCYLVLRRVESRSITTMIAVAFLTALPVSMAYATVNFMAFSMIEPMDKQHSDEHYSIIVEVVQLGLSWYFFVVAWEVLYVALCYAAKVRSAERNVALYRAQAQNAQIRALRYQINPHFLFNTLNSLSTLIMRRRNDEAEKMVINLAAFFRASLTGEPTEDVSLADEIKLQKLYLDIELSRFPDRLRVVIDVPDGLEQAAIPGFILQPLVENAIKYGVSRSLRQVTITISAERRGDHLRVVVEDDGDVLPHSAMSGTGVGLRNVRERLAARFGEQAHCEFGRLPEGGFRAELRMPLLMLRSLAAS